MQELRCAVRRHGILDDEFVIVERLRLERLHSLAHERHPVLRE